MTDWLWRFYIWLTGPAPTGKCPYCEQSIYVPFADHCDHCQEFSRHLESIWRECYRQSTK